MRTTMLAPLLLLAACSREEPPEQKASPASAAAGQVLVYAAGERDRMCVKGDRTGFVTYASGSDANCSVRGSLSDRSIVPDGDEKCTIPRQAEGDRVTLGPVSEACAYYCGPGASFAGKTFVRMDNPDEVTDLAGDPLC